MIKAECKILVADDQSEKIRVLENEIKDNVVLSVEGASERIKGIESEMEVSDKR